MDCAIPYPLFGSRDNETKMGSKVESRADEPLERWTDEQEEWVAVGEGDDDLTQDGVSKMYGRRREGDHRYSL